MLIGGEHVKPEYREVVLQSTKTKTDNGRAVWSSKSGVELHLYSDARGNWRLSGKYPSEDSDSLAYFEGGSAAPPGERMWKLAKSMRDASEDGDDWGLGKLTLLCGEAGAARAVRGFAQHTCMSACCHVLRPGVAESCRARQAAGRVGTAS